MTSIVSCILLGVVAATPAHPSADATYPTVIQAARAGDTNRVAAVLNAALARHPGDARLALFRAAWVRSYSAAAAAPLFRQIVRRGTAGKPNADIATLPAPVRAALAMIALDSGRVAGTGLAELRQAARQSPADPVPQWLLAQACQSQGRTAAAIAAYQPVLARLAPGPAPVHTAYASLLESQGRTREALPHRQRAAKGEPTATNLNRLARTLTRLHRDAEAEAAYQQAAQTAPDDPATYTPLGALLQKRGRSAEAETAYQTAATLGANSPKPWNRWGGYLERQGEWAAALDKYRQALAVRPDDRTALWGMTRMCRKLGRAQEAKQYEAQARAAYPAVPAVE